MNIFESVMINDIYTCREQPTGTIIHVLFELAGKG